MGLLESGVGLLYSEFNSKGDKVMKKSTGSVFLVFVFLTGFLNGCAPAPTPSPIPPTFTPEPTATATLIPSPTLEPTAVPTIVLLPQQWNGTYTYPQGAKQNISLLIEKMKGTTFTGKMIWQSFGKYRGATLKMNGEYITDFGNQVEQAKWNNLEDYKDGDKSGTWLKWTETEVIAGGNYTTNGWYYAHIREDGTMVAVYFFNNTETVADTGKFVLEQVTP
jgi:hypothetical protein